ncbi:hypothetical protein ACFLTB_06935, partial [Chloroflexota bacterium]
ALNPDEFAEFVRNIRLAEGTLHKASEEVSADELEYREYKSLMKVVAKESIKAGDIFTLSNLTVMRARKGEISGKQIKTLLNKKSVSAYEKYEPIKRS